MTESVDRLQAALKRLPTRPWTVDLAPPSVFQRQGYTLTPGDQRDSMVLEQTGFEVGTLRMPNGGNVVEPWPESNSMIVALPGVLTALAELVNAAQAVADDVEERKRLKEG